MLICAAWAIQENYLPLEVLFPRFNFAPPFVAHRTGLTGTIVLTNSASVRPGKPIRVANAATFHISYSDLGNLSTK